MLELLGVIFVVTVFVIWVIVYIIRQLCSKCKKANIKMDVLCKLSLSCFVISVGSWIINKFILNTVLFASLCRYGLVAAIVLFVAQMCIWIFTK